MRPDRIAFSYRKLRRPFKFYDKGLCILLWWKQHVFLKSLQLQARLSGWDVFVSLFAASWHMGLSFSMQWPSDDSTNYTQLFFGFHGFLMFDVLQSVRGLHYTPAMQLMRQSSEQVPWLTRWNSNMDLKNDNLEKIEFRSKVTIWGYFGYLYKSKFL